MLGTHYSEHTTHSAVSWLLGKKRVANNCAFAKTCLLFLLIWKLSFSSLLYDPGL